VGQRAPVTADTVSSRRARPDGAIALPRSERYRYPPATLLIFALTFACIAVPIGSLFVGSFRTEAPGAPVNAFTWNNWIAVYAGEEYHAALLNTVLLCTTVAVLSVAVGGVLAWILARSDAPWRAPLAVLMVVPLMISNLITALAWVALAAPNAGFLNVMMRSAFGIQTVFNIYSFSGIALVFVLHYASLAFVAFYAALQLIDGSLEDASRSLGAGTVRTAIDITLPLIWPTTVATFVLIFIFTAENFSVPMLLGGRVGFHTLASWVYMDMTGEPARPTLGAAAGIVLLSIGLVGTLWQRRITRHGKRYVTIGGKGTRARITELGRWKYAATAAVLGYLFLAVGLPYAMLGLGSLLKFVTPRLTWTSFSIANYENFLDWENLLPVYNSLLLAGLCGLAATFAYVLIAYLIRHTRGLLGDLMDYIVFLPTAIPALALGVGFVWALLSLPVPIYGTIWALAIAYFTRFLGIGVRQSQAAFTQVSDDLVDAARICGASPLQSFRDIMLPLLRPVLLSLWTVLFIFIFMELSITIMLYTPDTMTLPVLLWSRMSSGHQTLAFAVAMIQATIVLVILFVSNRLFGTLRSTLQN
jgi:iron(III) transport system permease protein